MKSTLTSFLFIVFVNFSFTQQMNVAVSSELETQDYNAATVKVGNHYIRYRQMGSSDHLMHGFGWNKTRLGLEVMLIDSNMVELKRKPLSNGDRVYGPFITDIKKINGKIYIIYHEVQPKNIVGNIMAVEVNPETLEAGSPKIIGQIANTDYKLKLSESLQYSLKYFFMSSPDGKKNLVMLSTGDKRCFISVLDENMNVLWSRCIAPSNPFLSLDYCGNSFTVKTIYAKQ